MKAVVCTKYGPPEVLQIKEVEKPIPKNNEILVKVHASTVSSGDCRIRSFTFAPWFRPFGLLMFGIRKPRKNIPGDELAGEIEAVGKDVTKFKVGNKVFGFDGMGLSSHAEYLTIAESKAIDIMPEIRPCHA